MGGVIEDVAVVVAGSGIVDVAVLEGTRTTAVVSSDVAAAAATGSGVCVARCCDV